MGAKKQQREKAPRHYTCETALPEAVVDTKDYQLLVGEFELVKAHLKTIKARLRCVFGAFWAEEITKVGRHKMPPPHAVQELESSIDRVRTLEKEVRALKLALCRYSLDQDRTLRIASAIEERAEGIFKEIQ